MMNFRAIVSCLILIAGYTTALGIDSRNTTILNPDHFRIYIDYFNKIDNELYRQHIPNDSAWSFLKENIPFFECPDKEVEKTYYFRWWTYRKHIKETPAGFIITEFLPDVRWAGKYNSICCPAGHHFYEGRWLRDTRFLNQYASFWFTEGDPRTYSFWAANALLEYYKVTGDSIVPALLPALVKNFRLWEPGEIRRGNYVGKNADGLFSMKDTCDGMEFQIGGSGKRPTINSYQYGDALAIAELAAIQGDTATQNEFLQEAQTLKHLVETKLWDNEDCFFKTITEETDSIAEVRELQGYTPWYMNLPDDNDTYAQAWKYLLSDDGFRAPYGFTTAEQTHPRFMNNYKRPCSWDGRSWPFATSITLTAMANLLNNYHQNVVTPKDYMDEFVRYSRAQRMVDESGNTVPWIDESQDPFTGDWLTRTALIKKAAATGPEFIERGKDYNHSSYCDLLISGLIGIRPQSDNTLVINPLVQPDAWPWFCLDGVSYKGHVITVVYDRRGTKYGLGKGLFVYVDGELKSQSRNLKKISIDL